MLNTRSRYLIITGVKKPPPIRPPGSAGLTAPRSRGDLPAGRDPLAAPQRATIYSAIPPKFLSAETWPKSTNLLCWNCSLPVEGPPRFLPSNPVPIDDSRCEWETTGNFCSWACVSSYIESRLPPMARWDAQQHLSIVRAQIEKMPIRPVRPAPPMTVLKLYCGAGGITQKEYQQRAAALSAH